MEHLTAATNNLPSFAGILTFLAAGISLYINSKKAGNDVVDKLAKRIKDLEVANDVLEKTDIEQQRDLNGKTLEISKMRFENRTQEEKLKEYYQIITDKDPKTQETQALIVQGVNRILEKLEGAEVTEET